MSRYGFSFFLSLFFSCYPMEQETHESKQRVVQNMMSDFVQKEMPNGFEKSIQYYCDGLTSILQEGFSEETWWYMLELEYGYGENVPTSMFCQLIQAHMLHHPEVVRCSMHSQLDDNAPMNLYQCAVNYIKRDEAMKRACTDAIMTFRKCLQEEENRIYG